MPHSNDFDFENGTKFNIKSTISETFLSHRFTNYSYLNETHGILKLNELHTAFKRIHSFNVDCINGMS